MCPVINLPATDALAMPVEQLAFLVLRDLVETSERSEHNYLIACKNDRARLGYKQSREAREAISEALTWLRAHCLIARDPDLPSDAAIFVTRLGYLTLNGQQPR